MPTMRLRVFPFAISLTVLALWSALAALPAHACPVGRGTRLLLVSQELDPDVFLWDSAERLARYAVGDFDVETVLKHTTLLRPFTRAVVLGCRPLPMKAPYVDGNGRRVYAVGVRITSGRSFGRNGWVASTDIRGQDGRTLSALSKLR